MFKRKKKEQDSTNDDNTKMIKAELEQTKEFLKLSKEKNENLRELNKDLNSLLEIKEKLITELKQNLQFKAGSQDIQ